jgi:hypothetical protein
VAIDGLGGILDAGACGVRLPSDGA